MAKHEISPDLVSSQEPLSQHAIFTPTPEQEPQRSSITGFFLLPLNENTVHL